MGLVSPINFYILTASLIRNTHATLGDQGKIPQGLQMIYNLVGMNLSHRPQIAELQQAQVLLEENPLDLPPNRCPSG